MATQCFLVGVGRLNLAVNNRGLDDAGLNGVARDWISRELDTARGAGSSSVTVTSVTGPTNGIEPGNAFLGNEFISAPLAADATISGTITFNIRAAEADMAANAGAMVYIDRLNNVGQIVSRVTTSEFGTELSVGSEAANNWTATGGAVTSTDFDKGDRIRVVVAFNDAGGTMAAASTLTLWYAGTSGGASGDSYVTFTENLTFQSTLPAGSIFYPTDTASTVDAGVVEKELSTAAGSADTTVITNSTTGFTPPIQYTVSAGGTAVEWYSPQLAAFTLSGPIGIFPYAWESSSGLHIGCGGEVAVCAEDGTDVRVFGYNVTEEMTSTANTFREDHYIAGQDIAVADGERLRFRLYIDDAAAMVAGGTGRFRFGVNGVVGTAGVSYIQLTETVDEFTPGDPALVSWYTTL